MNIAFAGFRHGHIYGLYNSAHSDSRVTVTGCFEKDAAAKEAATQRLGEVFTYETYDDILNDPSVEAVAIGDYYAKRGRMVIEALQAGKHVICDKPICTKLSELNEIERLSKEKGLKVCCMLDLRYMPQVQKARELISQGVLGKIHIASFSGQHCLDYGNRPGWYFEKGKHGGTINDIAIHGLDLLRLILGKNLTSVSCAKVWNAFAAQEPEFRDCGQFMVQMEDVAVMADVSYAAPKYQGTLPTYWNFKFWGSNGMLQFSLEDNKIYLYRNNLEVIDCGEKCNNTLSDFLTEVAGTETVLTQMGILDSQRQVLTIQKHADAALEVQE